MPRRQFQFFQRHLRFSDCSLLPGKDDPNYHAYQNIIQGCNLLREKSIRLWHLGRFAIYDEGRVTQTSKRATGTTRNISKPIKYGQDVLWLCGIMEETQGIPYNHVIPCGACSVTDPNEKSTVNHLRQLTIDDPEIDGSGRYLMTDNKFGDVQYAQELFEHNLAVISAVSLGKTKHLSALHQKSKKHITNNWDRGQSELWQNNNYSDVSLTLWNDSNSASFIGTGLKPWYGSVDRQSGSEKVTIKCPIMAVIYNSAYH
eukprot:237044_1